MIILDRFLYSLPYFVFKNSKESVKLDFDAWKKALQLPVAGDYNCFIWLFKNLKEYRSVFYWRLGRAGKFLRVLYKDHPCLYIQVPKEKAGTGLVIHHGHSSIILIEACGNNCQIWQNVTLGKKYPGEQSRKPRLGNNVRVCAGAIVLGDVTIGDNVTIGAASVVLKSVPDNCTVVGNPARIIRRDGIAVNESL